MRQRAGKVSSPGNREYNAGWHTALDLDNLLTVAQAITMSAIERRESRGAQFREDYPEKDEAHAKFNLVIRKSKEGIMEIAKQPTKELRADLKQVVEEMK